MGGDRRGPPVLDTSHSLLERLQSSPPEEAWRRLVDLYAPLLARWASEHGLQTADRDDLVQEVLSVLVRDLPGFRHNGRPGAFRAWLRGILVNRLRSLWRARRAAAPGGEPSWERLAELEDPDSPAARRWDEEHNRLLLARLLRLVEPQFEPATLTAFRRVVLQGERPAAVAASLGVTVNAVLLAKSRVLRRLRQEAAGLCD
jgi:RNA polymerase sigma-70 factor (ECF subfamily)